MDFILSKHGKGKLARYYKMINVPMPNGIIEISKNQYYKLAKLLVI